MAEFYQEQYGYEWNGINGSEENGSLETHSTYLGQLADSEIPAVSHHFEHQLTYVTPLPSGSQQFWPSGALAEASPQLINSPKQHYSTQPSTEAFAYIPLQFEPITTPLQQPSFGGMQPGSCHFEYNGLNAPLQTPLNSRSLEINNQANESNYPFVQNTPNPDHTERQDLVSRHLARRPSIIYWTHSPMMHHIVPGPENQSTMLCSPPSPQSLPPHFSTTDANTLAATPEQGTSSQTTSDVSNTPNPETYLALSNQVESRHLVSQHWAQRSSIIHSAYSQPGMEMHHIVPAPENQNNLMCSTAPPQSLQSQFPITDANALTATPEQGPSSQTTVHVPNRRNLRDRRHFVSLSPDIHLQLFNNLAPGMPLDEFTDAGNEQFQSICTQGQAFSSKEEAISLELIEEETWRNLYIESSEMITTKAGRRIFPHLSVKVSSLDPDAVYSIVVDLVQLHPNALTYDDGAWTTRPSTAQYPPPEGTQPLFHVAKHSPQLGSFWMSEGVDLKAAKITHEGTTEQDTNMMFVNSQHMYIPRYHILRHLTARGIEEARKEFRIGKLCVGVVGSFIIPGTKFIAVTSYQNPEVVRIKIQANPFAAGHRKRKREDTSTSTSN